MPTQTIQSILSGALQGFTELLPVSSSGHLILLDSLFAGRLQLVEIAVLHIGTLAAIALVMRDRLKLYFNLRFWTILIPSFVPAGIIGFLAKDFLDGNPLLVLAIPFVLVFWGIVLIIADKIAQNRPARKLEQITLRQSLIVGLGQCLALIPGTSRSGVTTIFGIASGLDTRAALEFSFLSGMPLIAASGAYGLLKTDTGSGSFALLMLGVGVAFVTGVIAALILRKFITKKILTYCGIYRILLGIVLLIL